MFMLHRYSVMLTIWEVYVVWLGGGSAQVLDPRIVFAAELYLNDEMILIQCMQLERKATYV